MITSLATWMPWTDRAGRLSWLKLVVLLALVAPFVWMVAEWRLGWYSARPLADAIRESGDWALRILLASLAVTPLRYVVRFNKLILVRRMVGLAALFYTLFHILLWCADLGWDWASILSQMFTILFLIVGLVATLVMAALGITSNDWGIRRLGAKGWNQLHSLVYAATALSALHFFMESKLDVTQAALLAGLFLLAMAFRVVRRKWSTRLVPLAVAAATCGVATALMEAFSYSVSTRIGFQRVLNSNLDFSYEIRPAWWVLAAGLAIAALAEFRARTAPPRPAPAKTRMVASAPR